MSREPRQAHWGRRFLLILVAGAAIYALAGIPREQWRALVPSSPTSLEPARVLLRAFDAVTVPHREALLRVKIEKEDAIGIYPAVAGVRVLFKSDEELLGSARTNPEGVANFEWVPPWAGEFTITASVDPESPFKSMPETLLVGAYDPDDEFIVVGFDGTLAKPTGMKLPFEGSRTSEAVRDAAPTLVELSRSRHVLYVTGRDERAMHAVQSWLAAKGFPLGVTFFRDYEILSTSLEDHAYHEVQRLKALFPHLSAGIGSTTEESRAFLRVGLKTIVLGDTGHADLPAGVVPAASWADVKSIIQER
jgi:hypothetical protein